jgi:hypothetical protein
MQLSAKQPFRSLNPQVLGDSAAADAERAFNLWLEGLKRQAKANLSSAESVRIAWQARFKQPRYSSFGDYTPEEVMLELWEQFYFENPESVELHGLYKRRNAKTGYSYYVTGDPVLDQLEEAFGRGERPDLSVLDGPGGGRDIFREPVFMHTEKGPGFKPGVPVAPQQGLQGVQETQEGAKITAGGAKVSHTDFSSDAWLKAGLEDDLALKALAAKLK